MSLIDAGRHPYACARVVPSGAYDIDTAHSLSVSVNVARLESVMNASSRYRNKTALALAMACAFAIVPREEAEAASCVWNPTTGNWDVAGNWSCGIVPSGPPQDSATIGLGKTVTVDTSQSIFTLGN